MTEVRTEVIETPVLRPLPEELFKVHEPAPLPSSGPLTIKDIEEHLDDLFVTLELYRLDKEKLQELYAQ